MDRLLVESHLARIENDLLNNILPFWIRHAVDRDHQTFVGELANDLTIDRQVARGALLTSRILWTYAAAHRYRANTAFLDTARHAYGDLMRHFADLEHGGFYWSIAADGTPLEKRKQVYGQVFAIYALSEFHQATGEREPLDQAIAMFHLIEKHARDREHGGYFEAYADDWTPVTDMRLSAVDMNTPKSQNTLLHVMEAYTNLMRVWPDAALKQAQTALLGVMLDRVLNECTHHLGLFFTETWEVQSDKISYGHDIEAAWLLTEAATVLRDNDLIERTRRIAVRIADVTLAEGVDSDGAVYNEGSPTGITDTRKEWWPQAEAVVGFINAYQIGGDGRHLAAALRTWDFIESRLIDHQHGEWFRGVTREGSLLTEHPKVSFWKCPYHNARAGMEASVRLRSILAAPLDKRTRPAVFNFPRAIP